MKFNRDAGRARRHAWKARVSARFERSHAYGARKRQEFLDGKLADGTREDFLRTISRDKTRRRAIYEHDGLSPVEAQEAVRFEFLAR